MLEVKPIKVVSVLRYRLLALHLFGSKIHVTIV